MAVTRTADSAGVMGEGCQTAVRLYGSAVGRAEKWILCAKKENTEKNSLLPSKGVLILYRAAVLNKGGLLGCQGNAVL